MDVLFCSINDWANVGALFAKALKTVGVEAVSAVRYPHEFDYPDKSVKWTNWPVLQTLANQAQVVVMMHSVLFNRLNLRGKRVGVFHGGSAYRKNKESIIPSFNRVCDVTLVQTGDLMDDKVRNQVWVMPPVDTESLNSVLEERPTEKLVYAHHPSNPKVKGSGLIVPMLEKLGVAFKRDFEILPHTQHINRLRACDVYVETMATRTRDAKPFGSWGMSAMEAAALGKIVITNDLWRKEYEAEFGPCPLLVANTPIELETAVLCLQNSTSSQIVELKAAMREWVVKNHSFKPVGEKLRRVLL